MIQEQSQSKRMAKEINLFESEMPEAETEVAVALPAAQAKPMAQQLTLQGFVEKAPDLAKRMERENKQYAKKIIEALLFSSNEPLSFQKLREIIEFKLPIKPKTVRDAIDDLQEEYFQQQRAFRLEEVAQGYILKTCEEYGPFIEQIYRNKRTEKLSQASAEVLAIIAYKQPISRPQIEAIRGVDCSGIMQNLLERELVQPVGKSEGHGKPTIYGVTNHFLLHFGLRDLAELPGLQNTRLPDAERHSD